MGCIVEKATGQKLVDFAYKYLFEPLGIENYSWLNCPRTDLAAAAWGLRLRPRDMLKFGLLYLNNGKWKDKQIIPANWVNESLTTKIYLDTTKAGYGYQFWTWHGEVNKMNIEIAAALGNGDQNIILDKNNGLVIVATAGNYDKPVPKNVVAMLIDYIYPALQKNK